MASSRCAGLAELARFARSVRTPSKRRGGGLASSRCAGLAELARFARSVRTPSKRRGGDWLPPAARDSPSSLASLARFEPLLSGEGGIRTPKPVRAPVFETGALPFCHLSRCRIQGSGRRSAPSMRGRGRCSARVPDVKLLKATDGVGLGRYAPRARSRWSLGSNPRGQAFRPCLVELPGRTGWDSNPRGRVAAHTLSRRAP